MVRNTQHLPCPCGKSSDGYAIKDGWGHCFVCNKNFKISEVRKEDKIEKAAKPIVSTVGKDKPFKPIPDVFVPLPERQIGVNAAKRYNTFKIGDKIYYPKFKNGVHSGNKIRTPDKSFPQEGDVKDCDLFGQQAFPAGSSKTITVTEGQDDAMAAFEMNGERYACVSVDSSSSAESDCRRNFEYLNSFEQIVICFDNDEPGKAAAKKVANIGWPLGKLRIMTPRLFKDANDYKKAGKQSEFTAEWWKAPVYKPDGLLIGNVDVWDTIVNRPNLFSVDYPFNDLNRKTYGMRLSEVVIVTAETGVGKTSFLKEIEYSLLMNPLIKEKGYGIGFLHFEETNSDTALGLLSIHNSKPYHLPDVPRTEDELRVAFDAVLNTNRVVIWDHFGSNSVDAVLDKIRHMHALGCKYIVLDHLSIVVSDQSGDERKQLDEISTKLKTLCMNLNIAVLAVIHQNRQGQIRGTAGVEQLANIVIKLERDKVDPNEWRRNVTKLTVEKNRFSGKAGPSSYLWYNEATGRLKELTREEQEIYDNGGSINDDIIPFD